jgi:oxidase EvaA
MIDTPWHLQSKEASFLRSALTLESRFLSLDEFLAWFEQSRYEHTFDVREIPFEALDDWYFAEDPYRLRHRSGKFFTIEGLRVRMNYGPIAAWDQPIINQPEIGILGIITKVFDGIRYFLMQAKMEPGNVNILQLSPTVQATKSNYTKVHKGRCPKYLEYFTDMRRGRILVDQLQSEQGGRFLRKRNRNMVIEVEEEIPLHDEFCWLTLGQIKRLLTIENLVNMDSRTVLSCIPFAHKDWGIFFLSLPRDPEYVDAFGYRLTGFAKDLFLSLLDRHYACHTLDEIISWFTELKTRYELTVEQMPLDQLRRWEITDREIRHETGRYFSVIAVAVEAGSREVVSWTQPLLEHKGYGIAGFLTQKRNGTLHFLVQASLEPGNLDLIEMGPTVSCSNPAREGIPYLDLFRDPDPDHVRYSVIQSEEGGRFYHFQNRYMILEVPETMSLDLPENFIWMTLGQIIDFTKYSYFNIEARNLLSCLSLI